MRCTRHAGAWAFGFMACLAWPNLASPQSTPHVAVVSVDPASYAPGAWDARAAATRAFYETHRDAYDFLILFPTFPIDLSWENPGEVLGKHWEVRNDVSGIGVHPYDAGALFGSGARLKGVIDIHSLVPGVGDGSFGAALGVVAHELAHQWSGHIAFRDPNTGVRSTALLNHSGIEGLDGAHWSYTLSSDASVLFGSSWRDLGDGSFTADESRRRYSPLDLYLMGFLAPSEVPPFTLIEPAVGVTLPANGLPPPDGTRLAGTGRTIAVSDVIAAEGPRTPSAITAQHEFRAAFVVLTAPGQNPTAKQLGFVDALRREWANQSFFLTRGRGLMETELVEAPGPVASTPSIQAGIDWLVASQQPDGRWFEVAGVEVRDTHVAVETLAAFPPGSAARAAGDRGAAFLASREHRDADGCARAQIAVSAVSSATGVLGCFDRAWIDGDGGIAASTGYGSTVIDSVLTGLAFRATGTDPTAVEAIREYLLARQNPDGGWGYVPGWASQIQPTALALQFLAGFEPASDPINAALSFLDLHRDPLGDGFGDVVPNPGDTAQAAMALAAWSALTPATSAGAAGYLLAVQRPDGSWEGSAFETALAIRALRTVLAPNLALRSVSISAAAATDGEVVLASAHVVNSGMVLVDGATVQAFDSNGLPFTAAVSVPSLSPGQRATVPLALDTQGHAGSTMAFFVVDPEGRLDESSENDNRVAAPLAVLGAPPIPDLVAVAGSVSASPSPIESLPASVTIGAVVGNVGQVDAPGAVVEVRVRGVLAGRTSVDLPARSRAVVAIPVTVGPGAGDVPVDLVIDPDGAISEAREDNNAARITIPIVPGVDLRVASLTLTPSTLDQGQDLQIAYVLSNVGTTEAQVGVEVRVLNETGRALAVMLEPVVVQAGAALSRSASWRATAAGPITVTVDARHPADRQPSDNVAEAHAIVLPSGKPNLVIRSDDLVASPNPAVEGKPVTLTATVRNAGGDLSGPFALELLLGSPTDGRRLGRWSSTGLNAGASWTESVTIPVESSADLVVVAVADPDAAVSESDELDNTATVAVPVRALPDLVLGTGALVPSTSFPRVGQVVDVAVTVSNGGGQPSAATEMELRWAPAGGPEAIVQTKALPAVDAGGSATESFTWSASLPGDGTLVAVVNGSRSAVESNYGNDRAERSVLVQNAVVAVTNPYFSPNGDGIKDQTELFWRGADDVEVTVEVVRSKNGETVRRLQGKGGSLVWDGRDDAGRVVRDGTYFLTARAGAEVLGNTTAVVDTNRSPLHEAPRSMLETEDAGSLVWDWYGADARPLPDDSGIVLYGCGRTEPNAPCGLYLQRFDGTAPVYLKVTSNDAGWASRFALSPDGSTVAFLRNGCSQGAPRAPGCVSLHLVSVPGGEDRIVWQAPGYEGWSNGFYAPVFSPDGHRIAFSSAYNPAGGGGFTIEAVGIDGSDHRLLATGYDYESLENPWWFWPEEIAYSPDGEWVSFVDHHYNLAMNRDGSPEHVIVYRPPPQYDPWQSEPDGSDRHLWVPSGREITSSYEDGIIAVDVATHAIRPLIGPSALDVIEPNFIRDGKLGMDPWGEALAFPTGPAGELRWGRVDGPFRIMLSAPPGAAPKTFWESPIRGMEIEGFVWSSSGSLMQVMQWENSLRGYHHYVVRSLGNLATRISALRVPNTRYVTFRGTATDLNFERYEIRARLLQDGEVSRTVVTSAYPVSNAELGTWVPQAPGVYEATLVAFDKAGNARQRRTRFTWGDVSPIANLRRDPEFISPNGDGVQDAAIVSYSVIEPVTIDIAVTDDSGNSVRTMQRTYLAAQDSSVSWDGTDDSGVLVPDGVYWLVVEGSKFRIVVDTKRPVVEFALLDDLRPQGLFDFSPKEVSGETASSPCATVQEPSIYDVPQVLANASWQATDQNLVEWRLESVSGTFTETFARNSTQSPMHVQLAPPDIVGRSMRIAAIDRAGNVTYSQEESYRKALFLLGYGLERLTNFCISRFGLLNVGSPTYQVYPTPFYALSRFRFSLAEQDPLYVPYGERALLVFSHTIPDPIASFAVAYRRLGDSAFTYDYSVENFKDVGVLWDADHLQGLGELEFFIEAIDVNGNVYESEIARFVMSGTGVDLCLQGERRDQLRFSLGGRDLHELRHDRGTLEFRAGAGTTPVRVDQVRNLTWEKSNVVLGDVSGLPACVYEVTFDGYWDDDQPYVATASIDVCGSYLSSASLSGSTAYVQIGETYRPQVAGVTVYLPDPAKSGGWVLARELGPFEETTPVAALDVSAQKMCAPAGVKLVTHLGDGRIVDEGAHSSFKLCEGAPSVEIPCTRVDVAPWVKQQAEACSGRTSQIYVPIAGTSTRTITALDATLVTPAGVPLMALVPSGFAPDDKIISALATIPVELLAEGTYLVRADVVDDAGYTARDVSTPLEAVVVEHAPPILSVVWPRSGETVCPAPATQLDGRVTWGVDVRGSASDAHLEEVSILVRLPGADLFVPGSQMATNGTVSGSLGRIVVQPNLSGDYAVRVAAHDAIGNETCSPETIFHLSGDLHLSNAAAEPALFSPDSDGKIDTTVVSFQLDERAVIRSSALLEGGRTATIEEIPAGAGTSSFTWDGVFADGSAAPDGPLAVVLEATGPCGQSARATLEVAVDTQPPTVQVLSPGAGARVSADLLVTGSIRDAHLRDWEVSLAAAGTALFQPVASGTGPTVGILATIPVRDLPPGDYVVRVGAADRVGHSTVIDVPIAVAPGSVLEQFAVLPALVSPNGDGTLDFADATVALKQAANVSLHIEDSAGAVVATVLSDESLAAGSTTVPLANALAVVTADGEYVAHLTASASGVTEEGRAPLSIDRSRPEIVLSTPEAKACIAGPLEIGGNIADAHLRSWAAKLRTPGAPDALLASGGSPVSGTLAVTPPPPEGLHEAVLFADDLAGNSREISAAVVADRTAPAVAIASPLDGAWVSGQDGPVAIDLGVHDLNLVRWSVQIDEGLGSPHDVASGGREGPTAVSWDAGSEADGEITLVARASDCAGNTAVASARVSIDNTPPLASLGGPRDSYVRAPFSFVGTADDANLERWTVELAPGPAATAFAFVSVASGTTPVRSGTLGELISLPADGVYTARLTVRDWAGNVRTDAASFVIDTTPPVPPVLQASVRRPSDAILTWTASPDPDIVGYRVLRAAAAKDELAPLGTSLVQDLRMEDPGLADGTWRYAVIAVDSAGLESAPSNEASVLIDATPPTVAIAAPRSGEVLSGIVDVVGTAFSADDFKEYRLSVGEGATPASFALLRRSPVPVRNDLLAMLDTSGLAEGSTQTLRLEGEDLTGNVARVTVTVRVDNAPPAAPYLVSADAAHRDVTLVWEPVMASDLAGYIVYRNGIALNVPESALSDPRAYLINPVLTTFVDLGVPDGTFAYRVQAVDLAGNLSALSNERSVTIDLRPPSAWITSPLPFARVRSAFDVVAESDDTDIATVQLEARCGGMPFQVVGAAMTRPPWIARVDPALFPSPAIELRVVATDSGGRTDGAPESLVVLLDPELAPPVVSTHVEGRDVTLSWTDENPSGRVAGYRYAYDGWPSVPSPARPQGTASASSSRQNYYYTYGPGNAYDGSSHSTWISAGGAPQWWQLDLASRAVIDRAEVSTYLYASTFDVSLRVRGIWGKIARGVQASAYSRTVLPIDPPLEVEGIRIDFTAGTYVDLSEVVLSPVPLVTSTTTVHSGSWIGPHAYDVTAVSPFGGSAMGHATALIYLPSLDPLPAVVSSSPIAISGSGAAAGADVSILSGTTVVAHAIASSDGRFVATVSLALGPNTFTASAVDPNGNVSMPSSPVSTTLDPPPAATIELSLLGVTGSDVSLAFVPSGDMSSIAGFVLQRDSGDGFRAVARLGATARDVVDCSVPNGAHTYRIVALNARGFEGTPSNTVVAEVAVALPPAPELAVSAPPVGSALQLDWTFDGPETTRFAVERETSSGAFARIASGLAARTYLDVGLVNGAEYRYRVVAVDQSGNAGRPSNVAWGVPLDRAAPPAPRLIEPTVPGAPITLAEGTTVVAGLAELDARIELSQNARFGGSAVADLVSLERYPLSLAHQPNTPISAPPATGRVAYGYVTPLWNQGIAVEDLSSGQVFELSLPLGVWIGEALLSPRGDAVAAMGYSYPNRNHAYVGGVGGASMEMLDVDVTRQALAVAWSPAGDRLAYAERGTPSAVVVRDATGGARRTCSGHTLGSMQWISSEEVAGIEEDSSISLVACDVDTGAAKTILTADVVLWTPGARGTIAAVVLEGSSRWLDLMDSSGAVRRLGSALDAPPVFSPDRSRVAWISDEGEVVVAKVATGEAQGTGYWVYSGALAWPSSDVLLRSSYSMYDTPYELRLSGRFEIPVALDPGDNTFVAVALDEASNRSPPSEPIVVRFDTAQLPDLVVSAAIQPQVPIATRPANAIVSVRNAGAVSSTAADLETWIVVDGGRRAAPTVKVPSLAPGSQVTAVLPLDVSALAGGYVLTAVVDPRALLADRDRSNNRVDVLFPVSADGAIALTLTAAPASVPCDGSVTARVTIANPGPATDSLLRIVLVDLAGSVVVSAPEWTPVLPAAGTFATEADLPVGLALAGDYRVVASLLVGGSVAASGSMPVTIEPEQAITLALGTARAEYAAAQTIEFQATLTNASRNAPLSASIRFEISDASGAIVQLQPARAVPLVWMGSEARIPFTVAGGTLPAGIYLGRAVVESAGTVLANATVSFSVVAEPLLAGVVTVAGASDPPTVKAGTPALVTATARNVGTGAALGVVGHVVTVDGSGTEVGRTTFDVGDLAVSGEGVHQVALPTASLPLGTYGVILLAEYAGRSEALATTRFRVSDGRAPQLAFLAPSDGSFVRGTVAPRVRAFDDASGVAAVRGANGAATAPFALIAGYPLDGTWSGTIQLGPDGPYEIVMSAADAEGNDGLASPSSANPILLHVVSDTTPPRVRIDGVVPDALVNVAVTPVVVAEDINLARVDAFLDGVAFGGAAVEADGDHILVATATDRAGNSSSASVRFSIDRAPPSIAILGVAEGAFVAADVTPLIVVSDVNLESYSALLDGAPFTEGSTVTAEGIHHLVVAARDRAGNTAELDRTFTIDKTPPDIRIAGIQDGAYVAGLVSPIVTVTESNLLFSETTLDGEPFANGSVVSTEGFHRLSVRALDRAGNRTEASVGFTIDHTAPSIAVLGVDEGAFVAADVTPLIVVTDANLETYSALLDGVPFSEGSTLTAERTYHLTVTAHDLAGNEASIVRIFTIDKTPPRIEIAGVREGAYVAEPVSPSVTVTDANLLSSEATLDGEPFALGDAVFAEGFHRLTVRARDRAGNCAEASVSFVIDLTHPAISIEGVTEGEITSRDVVPVVIVEDANLSEWTTTVDGVEMPLGGAVTFEGEHVIEVVATDLAANSARATVRFEIDRTVPTLWASVQDGMTYDDAVSVAFGAADRNLTSVTATLDGVPVQSGVLVDAGGAHELIVNAGDAAGNEATEAYRFEIGGEVKYTVEKRLLRSQARVLAMIPCQSPGAERIEGFLREALPGTPIAFVRTEIDLLMQLRTGLHDVVIVAGGRNAGDRRCDIESPVPPLPPGTLTHRVEQEITEAVFRGLGVIVFREEQAAWPQLVEALGLRFEGDEPAGAVRVISSAVTEALRLSVTNGVELKLVRADGIATFERDDGMAAAVHAFGTGAAATFGFDLSLAEPSAGAGRLLAGAVGFVTPESGLRPRGVVAVGIDVTNERRPTATRVRETVDPALAVVQVLSGGLRLPTGEIEWRFDQASGDTERLAYVVRLPDLAGTYRTTTEVASVGAAGERVYGNFVLDLVLDRGAAEVAADATRLALAIPDKGPDAADRADILARLGSVGSNPGATAEDRERAIGDLLDAIDAAKALKTVDPTPLRLALDELLAVWEARP